MNHRLRRARLKKGLTQQQMASVLGYASKSGYSMIETGINMPPLLIAFKIAKLVEESVEYLFEENLVHEM